MKETLKTASVIEIYNRSIEDLKDKKRELQIEIAKIMGGKAGRITRRIIGVIVTIIGIFGFLGSLELINNIKNANLLIFFYIIIIFSGMKILSKSRSLKSNLEALRSRIKKIENEIQKKRIKKQSLLDAGEVIVSEDMKNCEHKLDKDPIVDEPSLECIDHPVNEKICPMCAETIKQAAIICRYCGNRFEEN